MKYVLFLVIAVSALTLLSTTVTYAISQQALQSIYGDSIYYQPQQACSVSSSNSGLAPGKSSWTSNTKPPYYLEEFAINVLQDLAQTYNVPKSDTVTQQHVLALIAWFNEEGGDIANGDLFNPLNTDEQMPGSTVDTGTGNEAYVSFDSGVEATVLTMVAPFQNRIGHALANPSTSADQVMNAITYFQNYPGNKAWAAADSTTTPGAQQQYLAALTAGVTQASANYDVEASYIMGTPKYEYYLNMHVPYSELVYGNTTSSSSSNTGTPGSASASSCLTTGSAPVAPSAYQNPLRSVSYLNPERIDQGVDYSGQGPVYALGDGTIENLTNSGWDFGGYDAFITELLSDGPAKGDYVYVAEGCVPVGSLTIGEKVNSNTVICHMINPSGSGIETGWAAPPGDGAAIGHPQFNGTDPTAYGVNYSQLLQKLGAPAGIMDGPVQGSLPPSWPTWQ